MLNVSASFNVPQAPMPKGFAARHVNRLIDFRARLPALRFMKISRNLFCISLDLHYLCKQVHQQESIPQNPSEGFLSL